MDKQQALTIIKQTLDQAIKSGVISNLNDAQLVINAFQTIAKEITKD